MGNAAKCCSKDVAEEYLVIWVSFSSLEGLCKQERGEEVMGEEMEGEGEGDKDQPLPEKLKRPHRTGVFPGAWHQYPLLGSSGWIQHHLSLDAAGASGTGDAPVSACSLQCCDLLRKQGESEAYLNKVHLKRRKQFFSIFTMGLYWRNKFSCTSPVRTLA